jgi:hypothetical protein
MLGHATLGFVLCQHFYATSTSQLNFATAQFPHTPICMPLNMPQPQSNQPSHRSHLLVGLPEILVSLAVPGVMLAAIVAQVGQQQRDRLSDWSTEWVRGERLPILTFPTDPPR